MKVFHEHGSVNFVDKNNVFLGYEISTQCSEDAWYLITKNQNTSEGEKSLPDIDLEEYIFDTSFFKPDTYSGPVDSGGSVCFRAINSQGQELFITLINYQNGYYGHGFTFEVDKKIIQDGCL